MARVEPIRDLEDIHRMEHVLKYYGSRQWMAFKFGINTSLRMSDICKLKVGQIRQKYLNLNENKTGKFRRIYINDQMRPILDEYTRFMDDEDYFLRSLHKNTKPTVGQFYRVFSDAAKYIGLSNIGTHSCRKTFAYHHYRNNNDLALLMTILNHSSERETLIYIGVVQDEIDRTFAETFI